MATPRILLWLRSRFITGFFVAVPLIISVAALVWIFYVLDDLTGPAYERLLGRNVPGLGLLTTVAFVLVVGVVGNNVLGKRIVRRGEDYLQRIPVFRTVYSPIRQLLVAFSPDNEAGLKRVVMVKDACGGLRLGFVTKEFTAVIEGRRQPLVAVYVPTNHLYLGDIFVYEPDAVAYPDISVQEGIRIFLTAGVAIQDQVPVRVGEPGGGPTAGSADGLVR
jgi:uncharacterized membrane protein